MDQTDTKNFNNNNNQHSKNTILGIRREDKNRWERRAPLTPDHVKILVQKGFQVLIQPSTLRTFPDSAYESVGAKITEDLTPAGTILAVKEVPIEFLYPGKTYLFFSHTLKAQPYNMPMLDHILENNIRLCDFELIRDSSGKRLVRFGKFAGYAGLVDTLHCLGDRLLALKYSTPFLHLGYSYCYPTLQNVKSAISSIGEEISQMGFPQELSPMIFGFTSKGHVSQGAQEFFNLLPVEWIKTAKDLKDIVEGKIPHSRFKVYGILIEAKDYSVHKDPKKKFDKDDFYKNPEDYTSVFHQLYAPYLSVIMNCMYWTQRFPRILTNDQMEELFETKKNRLLAVGDISCDVAGSIEFLTKTTSIDQPAFIYNPLSGEIHEPAEDQDYIYRPGILMCAVDNFPTEFPKEATQWFGDHLMPFMEKFLQSDPRKPYEEMDDMGAEMHASVMTCHGELTKPFEYIKELRKINEAATRNFLLLGAGLVAGPCVNYICRNPQNHITIVDQDLELSKRLAKNNTNATVACVDVKNTAELEKLIEKHAIVISLLPSTLNIIIGRSALKMKRPMITASYISPELRALDKEVREAGVIFLNEIGLDPGIDHLEAMRLIEEVHKKGGKVRSFVSWCGGLPLPEFADNPLAYKFSWNPRGFLSACLKDAKYLLNGRTISIPNERLFKTRQKVKVFGGFNIEGYPNRDSLPYMEEYGIKDEAETMFRGTLRYAGTAQLIDCFLTLGLLNEAPQSYLSPKAQPLTWDTALRKLIGLPKEQSLRAGIKDFFQSPNGFPDVGFSKSITPLLECLEWLGMLSPTPVILKGSWIDCFCEVLKSKMSFEPEETDMILLTHLIQVEWWNGSKEIQQSSLVVRGNQDSSAMSKTVGLPVAIAAELVVSGKISGHVGVVGPTHPDIYRPLLKHLENEGIKFIQKVKKE